jgi:putative hydrolase of the HAD superfamily
MASHYFRKSPHCNRLSPYTFHMRIAQIGPKIRAAYFDAVGTLLHPEPAAAVVYATVGRRFGSRHSVEAVSRRFADAFAREEDIDRAARLSTSEDREYRRWQSIVAAVLDDVADAAACFAELYRHFGTPAAWRVQTDAASVLHSLSERGYQVGVASNYDHRLHAVMDGIPELAWIQGRVVSAEVGWRKPAAEFFAALCRQAALPPEHILYVGDDPLNDYDGARNCGIPAVLFDPGDRHGEPRRRVRSMRQLLT